MTIFSLADAGRSPRAMGIGGLRDALGGVPEAENRRNDEVYR